MKPFQNAGGFVAGTLVHTKEGLKPIEQIKVGDYVLSQPEMKGGKAYKRVTRTFEYEDKDIYLIQYYKGEIGFETIKPLVVTGNYPFWIKDVGWTRADHLYERVIVELEDGSNAYVVCATRVYKTDETGKGFCMSPWGMGRIDDPTGAPIYITKEKVTCVQEMNLYYQDVVADAFANMDLPFYTDKVYNIEVEDFHTYYVNTNGLWAHNQPA